MTTMREDHDERSDGKFTWDLTAVVLVVLAIAVVLLATAEIWLPHEMPHR